MWMEEAPREEFTLTKLFGTLLFETIDQYLQIILNR